MEIRFRPLPPSTLARQKSPGQTPTEDGQSFVEVVESLTAADQTPDKDADAGGNREQQAHNPSLGTGPESAEDAADITAEANPESTPDSSESPSTDKADLENKPLGTYLDLTA